MVEIYGKLMEKTVVPISPFSSSRERKNLQYLTNELFEAAKADIKADRANSKLDDRSVDGLNAMYKDDRGGKNNIKGSNEGFTKFIKNYKTKQLKRESLLLNFLQK